MSDAGEQQSLLLKEESRRDDFRHSNSNYVRMFGRTEEVRYSDEDNWSDSDSSSASSYYSGCRSSSITEWENEVTAEGELFYIESFTPPKYLNKPLTSDNNFVNQDSSPSNNETKRKSTTKGKLVRLIRRRSSRRSTRKKTSETIKEDPDATKSIGAKVTFKEAQEGEWREVVMHVSGEGPVAGVVGRRVAAAESLLGLTLNSPPGSCLLMVAAVNHIQRDIKIGDYLKNINGEDVDSNNINSILSRIAPPCAVTLKLQRVVESKIADLTSAEDLHNKTSPKQSDLVRQLVSGIVGVRPEGLPYWVVYTGQEGGGDSGPTYCYPRQDNVLAAARGAFITIHHLAEELTPSPPTSTTVTFEGILSHIIYTSENKDLLLLAFPHSNCTLKEAELLNDDIVRCLRFTFQSLSRCFMNKENHSALDRIFSLVQAQYLVPSIFSLPRFEDLLPAAHLVALPRDAQVQIDDALSELESNDFGAYSDDGDGQRLYSIIGSSLYHKGYLLSSHLPRDDLADVNAWLRHNGLLSLCRAEAVRGVATWHEVFPSSTLRGIAPPPLASSNTAYCPPQGRWFLCLVGQGESLLGLLLESGGCTVKVEGNPGPETIYVKQAQATLQHIKEIEILPLADKWISNHCRFETASPDIQTKMPQRNSADNSVNISNNNTDLSPKSTPSPSANKKSQEVTSILKHRLSPDDSFINTGQYETSEDSTSQAASSVVSDEAAPILGRRAERQRASDTNSHSRLSDSDLTDDSDWGPFKDSYQSGYGGRLFDLSDLGRNLLSDLDYLLPMRLTAGEPNALFYFVQLDSLEGVVLCSTSQESVGRLRSILDNFRVMAPIIHDLLQNAIRFKKLKVQEVSESLINKSLIANKEHGMLFECPPGKDDSKKSTPLLYWVVGRLFFMPQPREVYICYQDSAPQNLVEIAFRLALSASG